MKWLLFLMLFVTHAFAQFGVEQPMFGGPTGGASCGTIINPTNVAGLMCQLDAGAKIYVDGGTTLANTNYAPVYRWTDSGTNSGAYVEQTSVSRRPLWVTNAVAGYPAVLFPGTSSVQRMDSPTWNIPIPYMVFAVFAATNFHIDGSYLMSGRVSEAGADIIFNVDSGDDDVTSISFGGITGHHAANTNTWYLLSGLFNNDSSYARTNGTLTSTGTTTALNLERLRLGNNRVPDRPGQFYLAELLVYTNAISTNDLMGVECYLRNKYGLP